MQVHLKSKHPHLHLAGGVVCTGVLSNYLITLMFIFQIKYMRFGRRMKCIYAILLKIRQDLFIVISIACTIEYLDVLFAAIIIGASH